MPKLVPAMNADDVELISRETLFRGYLRVERLRLRHRLFAGGMGGEIVREVVERGHAVGVLPYDPVHDRVVMIEQFRVGVYVHDPTRSPWSLEIVAGIIEPGESATAVSHREAEEEAGLTLEALEPMLDYYSSPGALSEHFRLFCARVDSTRAGGIHGLAEESEDIRVVVMSWAEAMAALAAGRVLPAHAVIALQWLALNREALLRRWLAGRPAPT